MSGINPWWVICWRVAIVDLGPVKPEELKAWLAHYADLPEASDIYALQAPGASFDAAGFTTLALQTDTAVV